MLFPTADAAVVASLTTVVVYLMDLAKKLLGINHDRTVQLIGTVVAVALSAGYYLVTQETPPLTPGDIALRAVVTALAVLAAAKLRSVTPDKRGAG